MKARWHAQAGRQRMARTRRARALRWALVVLAAAWMALSPPAVLAQSMMGTPPESAVKAAYLFNFSSFVEWPTGTPESADFVIGVYGDEAVAAELEAVATGRRVRGMRVVVRRDREPDGEPVHIAYFGDSREGRVRDAIGRLPGPVLVVTHLPGGLASGAVLNFVLYNGRLRFEASQRAAEARGLRISSRLLALALAVEGR